MTSTSTALCAGHCSKHSTYSHLLNVPNNPIVVGGYYYYPYFADEETEGQRGASLSSHKQETGYSINPMDGGGGQVHTCSYIKRMLCPHGVVAKCPNIRRHVYLLQPPPL